MSGINFEQVIRLLSVAAIPGILAITLHEVAHGWVARRLGDTTAYAAGRLSLNPLKHVDPLGTIALPIIMLLLRGPIFGWAKPVPVSFGQLGNPRRDMVLVAAAGPGANMLMALAWSLIAAVELSVLQIGGMPGEWLLRSCQLGIQINVFLAVFNLIPIPPLDGGRILTGLLPPAAGAKLARIEPYGILIVLVLVMTALYRVLLGPILFLFGVFYSIAGFG